MSQAPRAHDDTNQTPDTEAPKKKKKRKLTLDIDEVDISEKLERKISACRAV